MSLAEDACHLRRGHGPQVLAALNNAVIGIVLTTGQRNLAAAQRAFTYAVDRILVRSSGSGERVK